MALMTLQRSKGKKGASQVVEAIKLPEAGEHARPIEMLVLVTSAREH